MTTSPRVVLIVDDDAQVREALRDALEDEGYTVASANGGGEALSLLRTGCRPGVILLDWNMQPMNGAQFMSELKNEPELASIAVVLVTADLHADAKMQAAPFQGLVRKPVDLDELFAYVSRYTSSPPP